MATAAEVVENVFSDAQGLASAALGSLAGFTNALNAAVQNAPTIDVTFTPISAPGASSISSSLPEFVEPDAYTSATLSGLSSAITARLAGGTGLPAGVEAAIWDRTRERELAVMQAAIDSATYDSEALGFLLPPGVTNDGVRRAQSAYYDNAAAASRDIAVKQAELEQANLQKIYDQAISFEGVLADVRFKNINAAAEVYRAGIEGFRAEVSRFQAEVEQDTKLWEAQIKQNDAVTNYTLNGAKINADIIRANITAHAEAAKVGAQVYAQLTSAAWGMIHVGAGVSAGGSTSVSYNYSNSTSSAPSSVTTI